jgi:hypothetical protein
VCCVVIASWASLPTLAVAQTSALVPQARLTQLTARASLASPVRLAVARRPGPVWTDTGLLPRAPEPRALFGLSAIERPGAPVFDATSRAWFASANGCLVEVRADGRLPVLVSGVQGVDVDVRGALRVAVSREPDHTIVLHRWGGSRDRRVLLRGDRYFRPRLSPDGRRLLVGESRPDGGQMWMLPLDGGAPVDLGVGTGGTWLRDSRRVLCSRVESDGHRITGADLWWVDTVTRRGGIVARTPRVHETEAVVSPDGAWVVFVDARTGDLMLAPTPSWMR